MSSARLSVLVSAVLVAGVLPAFAQGDAPDLQLQKDNEALHRFMNERLDFVRDAYSLDAGISSTVKEWMLTQLPAQKAYSETQALTLRRREMALASMVHKMKDVTDDIRNRVASNMQDQIYKIHAAAPLSLANVARKTESLLSTDQIELGRKVIINKYEAQLGAGPFDFARLDRILIRPVEVGSGPDPLSGRANPAAQDRMQAAQAEAHSSGAQPAPAKQPTPVPVKTTPVAPPTAPVPVSKMPPAVPPPAPPKPLEPAPPMDDWSNRVSTITAGYGFTDDQKKTAEAILKSCHTRAQDYLKSKKPDFDRAGANTDEAARTQDLKALNKEVDKIYAELTSRLESVASIEQRARVATTTTQPG